MDDIMLPTSEFEHELKTALNTCSGLTEEQKETIIAQAVNGIEAADRFNRLKSHIICAVRIASELRFSQVTMELMILDCFNASCEDNNKILKVS